MTLFVRKYHKTIGGLAEWSKAADLRSVGRCPREFEPRILHYFLEFFVSHVVVWNLISYAGCLKSITDGNLTLFGTDRHRKMNQ